MSKTIIAIIIIIIVAGAGYWIYQSISTPEGETVNWKTYRNENLGYEIQYPKAWTIKEEGNRLDIFHPQNIEEADIYGNVVVQFFSKEQYENFYEQQIDLLNKDLTLTIDEITIDGVNGFRGISYEQIESAKSMYMLELFPNKDNTGTFRIGVWAIDLGNETYQEQTKSIISTFKFLE